MKKPAAKVAAAGKNINAKIKNPIPPKTLTVFVSQTLSNETKCVKTAVSPKNNPNNKIVAEISDKTSKLLIFFEKTSLNAAKKL